MLRVGDMGAVFLQLGEGQIECRVPFTPSEGTLTHCTAAFLHVVCWVLDKVGLGFCVGV